jgi:O-antigen chain-terminating methyltransferase
MNKSFTTADAATLLPSETPDPFYRDFEDHFRGSRDVIKKRLEVYLPFVLPLHERYPDVPSVDLGCGRGEWLELLEDRDIHVVGVDIDDGMLLDCRTRSLPAHHCDALTYLATLPAESQLIVSAFHVVEHIEFAQLRMIVVEALRVLKPGGLLILETPNPENVRVGACSFYIDPTHRSPIPPDLLSFVTAYYGFHRTKVLRLQESRDVVARYKEQPGLHKRSALSLLDVIAGSSPDYAVVAQKHAEPEIFNRLNEQFKRPYGVQMEDLGIQREVDINHRFAELRLQVDRAESHTLQTLTKISQLSAQVSLMQRSLSWRITRPLRAISPFFGVARGSRLRGIIKALLRSH